MEKLDPSNQNSQMAPVPTQSSDEDEAEDIFGDPSKK